MDIPRVKTIGERDDILPGTRISADGQTQISMSKFKIDRFVDFLRLFVCVNFWIFKEKKGQSDINSQSSSI